MGQVLAAGIARDPELQLVLAVERSGHPMVGTHLGTAPVRDDLDAAFTDCEVVVDFSLPQATVRHARIAADRGVAFVSGTTGLDAEQERALRAAGERIALLFASNMSMGIAVAAELVKMAARRLPTAYDAEILEFHHRRKRDAPSGTALRLAGVLNDARDGLEPCHGRVGETGERSSAELGIHALRGGDVVGEHHVIFAGPGERLVVKHIADSREAFVAGTLAGVHFVASHRAGFYSMEDVLSLGAPKA
jgi:4-hydroxy-tetrahydrodipicolinate reductase